MDTIKPLPAKQEITLGCDPEFFFTKDGAVIGAEKIIPETGIDSAGGLTVIDGVQAELHPKADTCRQRLGNNIGNCLFRVAAAMPEGYKIDFSQIVEVTKSELDTMRENNKRFGCSSSMNTHKEGDKTTHITTDPLVYLKRSAGGHIHMGATPVLQRTVKTGKIIRKKQMQYKFSYGDEMHEVEIETEETKLESYDNSMFLALKNPDVLVPLLDIIVGNTAVLLDRDPGNIERRKNYGLAGEYRLPKYGLEYRTLSNFWLKGGRPIMSLMFGLARMCVTMVALDKEYGHVKRFMDAVDMEDIKKAINFNDFDLAMSNFKKIEGLIAAVSFGAEGHYPLYYSRVGTQSTIAKFHKLVEDGMDKYFNGDIVRMWTHPEPGYDDGFGNFCSLL